MMTEVSLFVLALSTLVSEDLACIAAGILVAKSMIGLPQAIAACLTGIFGGDMLLFAVGRAAGSSSYFRRMARKWASEEQLQRATAWLAQRGFSVVIISRFTPGLRLPTFLAAGLLRSRPFTFAGYFFVAAALWTPLLVGGTAYFGEMALKNILPKSGALGVAAILGLVLSTQLAFRKLRNFESRRLLFGFIQRKLRWEFWPVWAAYIPVAAYIVYLGIRFRGLTLFTATNPGIPHSGLIGESKSEILGQLWRGPDAVAEYALVNSEGEAWAAMQRLDLKFPIVLKPDVGERGRGVAIIRTTDELHTFFLRNVEASILQRYVPGVELGVFYVRYPGENHGKILSITEKHFPRVTGDGRSTLWHLILRDARAVCLANVYRRLCRRPMSEVIRADEQVQLVELGSHCRGAVFLDGLHLKTKALEQAIDVVSQAHEDFYLGRYDVRAASLADFRAGRFHVIELNGVSSEPTHIYDPAVSLVDAYRALFAQWRMAFEIGAINRKRGVRPTTPWELAKMLWECNHPNRVPMPRQTLKQGDLA